MPTKISTNIYKAKMTSQVITAIVVNCPMSHVNIHLFFSFPTSNA